MIAAPAGGGGEHLQALAKLSSVLMQPATKAALAAAKTPEEVVAVFTAAEAEEAAQATVAEPVSPVQGREIEERRVGKECRSRWSPYH